MIPTIDNISDKPKNLLIECFILGCVKMITCDNKQIELELEELAKLFGYKLEDFDKHI